MCVTKWNNAHKAEYYDANWKLGKHMTNYRQRIPLHGVVASVFDDFGYPLNVVPTLAHDTTNMQATIMIVCCMMHELGLLAPFIFVVNVMAM